MSNLILSDNVCNTTAVRQPNEEDALRMLDVAKEALSEIREMKGLEVLMAAGLEELPQVEEIHEDVTQEDEEEEEEEDEQMYEEHTRSEAELEQLSHMVEASLPKEQPDEKPLSRLSIADKKLPIVGSGPPPAPAPYMDVTPGHMAANVETTAATPVAPETGRRRWTALRKIFSRNKSSQNKS